MYLDGARIKARREELWLSIREASFHADVSYSTWRGVEKGRAKVRTSTARKIARALDVDPKSLAGQQGLHLVRESLPG